MLNYRGELMMLAVSMIGAWGWFFSKYAIAAFPPVGFLGLRFMIAMLLFLPFSYHQFKGLSKRQVRNAVILGAAQALNLFLWIIGLNVSTDLGEGAFLMSLSMLIAPLLAWLLFREKPAPIFWLAMPIAVLGLYLLASGRGELHFSFGSLLFLLCSCTAALFFVLNARFARDIPTFALITLQLAVVGLLCSAYSLSVETWHFPIAMNSWLWFACSVLLASNLRYWLQTQGQKICAFSTAAMIMLLEPVWTLLFSVWLFDEAVNIRKISGAVLILAALLIYRLQGKIKWHKNAT